MGSISHIENGSPSTWSNDDFSFEIVVGPDRFAPWELSKFDGDGNQIGTTHQIGTRQVL